jgi:hypothetical protein
VHWFLHALVGCSTFDVVGQRTLLDRPSLVSQRQGVATNLMQTGDEVMRKEHKGESRLTATSPKIRDARMRHRASIRGQVSRQYHRWCRRDDQRVLTPGIIVPRSLREFATIRLRLLKIAGRVIEIASRIRIALLMRSPLAIGQVSPQYRSSSMTAAT